MQLCYIRVSDLYLLRFLSNPVVGTTPNYLPWLGMLRWYPNQAFMLVNLRLRLRLRDPMEEEVPASLLVS